MAEDKDILQQTVDIASEQPPATPADVKKRGFFTFDLVKCVIVLAAIALVAGVLLGVINWVTYVDPDVTIKSAVAKYYSVDTSNIAADEARCISDGGKSYVKNCYIAKDAQDTTLGYCYYSVGSGAKDGTLELLVYISADGRIEEISVYEQGETAGYFNKVEKTNKTKYIGINVNDTTLQFVKNAADEDIANGIIAGVSTATYTSRGYHNAIAAAAWAHSHYGEVA